MKLLEKIIQIIVFRLLDLPQVIHTLVHAFEPSDCIPELADFAFCICQQSRLTQIAIVEFGHALNLA
jgi:hypothetical protein